MQVAQCRLPELLERVLDECGIPGAGVVISRGGARFSAHVGKANVESDISWSEKSCIPITCLMKFFISLVALHLADHGALDLEAPIGDYIAQFDATNDKAKVICIKHLMSHTSGYRGVDIRLASTRWGLDWRKYVEFFNQTPQLFSPGTVFNYEHSELLPVRLTPAQANPAFASKSTGLI